MNIENAKKKDLVEYFEVLDTIWQKLKIMITGTGHRWEKKISFLQNRSDIT